jgi:hypothetical protein
VNTGSFIAKRLIRVKFLHRRLQIIIDLLVLIVSLMLLQALLVISSQYFKPHPVVTGYRAHSVYYVYGVWGKEGDGETPRGCFDKVVQLVEVFSEVKDCSQFLIDELAYLGSPFIVWADKTYIEFLDESEVFPLIAIWVVLKELLID